MTVAREYLVPVGEFNDQLFALYSSDERFERIAYDYKVANPVSVEIDVAVDPETKKYTFYRGENTEYIDSFITGAEFQKLLALYRKDLQCTEPIDMQNGWERLGLFWNDTREDHKYAGYYYNLAIDKNFTNTIEYIDSLNLYERLSDIEKNK